jgi:integrase
MVDTNHCNHEWIESSNKIICKLCKQERLKLKATDQEGIKVGIRDDGRSYTVRDTRNRYFFPDEWIKFMDEMKEDSKMIFETLLMTGARIEECLRIKVKHIRWDRKYVTLYVTKVKAKKKEYKPTPRDVSLSSQYLRKLKKYISEKKLTEENYLFLFVNNLNDDRALKKLCKQKSTITYRLFRRALKRANIEDYKQFSLHNIRKTSGMWLKALGVSVDEICLRLGHDYNTYLKHYGSPDIFQRKDKLLMINLLGDIYGQK